MRPAEFARSGQWARLLPALLWQALIWLLSSRPWPAAGGLVARLWLLLPEGLRQLLPADKVVHAAFYGVLGLLWVWGLLRLVRLPLRRKLATAWLLATAWGALDELHQSYVPGRTADLWDLLADAVGAALAIGLWGLLQRRRAPSA